MNFGEVEVVKFQQSTTNAKQLISRCKRRIEWKTTIETKESKNNEGPDFDITFKQTRL